MTALAVRRPPKRIRRRHADSIQALDVFAGYAGAVERWASLFTAPPAPTIDGKLNPAFSEWMMGFPAGWATGPLEAWGDTKAADLTGARGYKEPTTAESLTRSAQLKAIGNAQQPQVSYTAFGLLARRLELEIAV